MIALFVLQSLVLTAGITLAVASLVMRPSAENAQLLALWIFLYLGWLK